VNDARADAAPAEQPPPPPGGGWAPPVGPGTPVAPAPPAPGATASSAAPTDAAQQPDVPTTPTFDDAERPLAPQVVTSWRIGTTLSLAIPSVVLTTVAAFALDGVAIWVGLGFVTLWLLVLTVYHPARYRRWRWRLTDLAVELRYGVVTRSQETVPYFRIQQIDIVQGPLDRLLHLSTLQVTTASATGRAALPGIAEQDAPGVRQELLARATAAVADHPGDLRDAV
jgi:uncharacterized protein